MKDDSPHPATILFVDLASYSETADPQQRAIAQSLLDTLQALLTKGWGRVPRRGKTERFYTVLTTGDGAAVVLWSPARGYPSREVSAIWLAAEVLAWADLRRAGIRCGVNSGELDMVKDPYGEVNVSGSAINIAQRVMDAARPGQLLLNAGTVPNRLPSLPSGTIGAITYVVSDAQYDVVVKHGHLLTTQTITGTIRSRRKCLPYGTVVPPQSKWYLQNSPTILAVDAKGRAIKKPPIALLRKYQQSLSFIGATNDQLAEAFLEARKIDQRLRWKYVEIFFLSDSGLRYLRSTERTLARLLAGKRKALRDLRSCLGKCVDTWELKEFDVPFYFASYWDAEFPNGRIHVSPYIWGANPKQCPGLDYVWPGRQQTPAYKSYLTGLSELRAEARILNSNRG